MSTSANVRPSPIDDVLGGMTAMLVALPSSIAFGVVAYSTLGAAYAGYGALAGLVGAAALGLTSPWIGRTAGLIAAPCAPSAAVLTALMLDLSTGTEDHAGLAPAAVLPLVGLTALLSSLLQVGYGLVRGGSLIKYIPYPVVTGYLSGVAVIIALAQLPKVLGLSASTTLAHAARDPSLWRLDSVLVGVATIVAMALAPKLTQRIPAAIVGLLGGVGVYFALSLHDASLLQLEGNGLLIGKLEASGSFLDGLGGRARSLAELRPSDIGRVGVHALTLSVLLSIDTLKTCVGLDALTRGRHDSNRELIGQGVGNFVSYACGGMPGAGTMGPTLVNVSSGGHSYRSGVFEGGFVVLAMLFLSPLIAWVPISTLAAILLVIAWRMFDINTFKLLRYRENRMDFAVIAAVVVTAVAIDLIAAAALGVAMTVVLFIRDQIEATVVRRMFSLVHTSSKTRRRDSDREILDRFGDEAVFCELQGHLFFGTTDQLLTQLTEQLQRCRYVLLDMRRVQSMDYTAAQLFKRMNAQMADRRGQLLLSGMPSGLDGQRNFEHYLRQLGIVDDARGVRVFDTLDGALEWMEDKILSAHGAVPHPDESVDPCQSPLFRNFSAADRERLRGLLREVRLPAGEQLFARGDRGDELFLVGRGAVAFYLPLDGGKRHHLDTAGPGSVFGEVAFLDRNIRAADCVGKRDCVLYGLSRAGFDDAFAETSALRADVYAALARILVDRLRQTGKQLQALEER